jgi:hypothetical protein
MLTWPEFARARPDLGEAGRTLFYQYGVGLGFLATVDRRGAPRLHPVCPLIADEGMFLFVIPSPKRRDLHRDGRCALHSFPPEDNEDAFCLYGRADAAAAADLRTRMAGQFNDERSNASREVPDDWELFELRVERCLLTRTSGHGDPDPRHTVWRSDRRQR